MNIRWLDYFRVERIPSQTTQKLFDDDANYLKYYIYFIILYKKSIG